jgi:hypothetical protein
VHRLAVNEVYCALKYKTALPGVSFRRWMSFQAPLSQALRLVPDGYVELQLPTGVLAAFVEIDRGHERLAVWKKKIANYLQLALTGEYERRFGQPQFRVFVIANSEKRLHSIRKVVRLSTRKIFWFTTTDAIRSNGFFAPIWLRPEGDQPQFLVSSSTP